jgi:hypothetical protein
LAASPTTFGKRSSLLLCVLVAVFLRFFAALLRFFAALLRFFAALLRFLAALLL